MAVATAIDSVDGTILNRARFHYDLENDVLYIRRLDAVGKSTFGEETDEGFTLLRTDEGDPAGLTVVDYWDRFGDGAIQSRTLDALQQRIEQWMHSEGSVIL